MATKRKTTKSAAPKAKLRISAEQQRARDWMLTKLKDSGLDAADADALGLQPHTEAESASLGLSRNGQGFKLPYYDAKGNELAMFRYRFSEAEAASGFLKGAKLPRYGQPLGTDPEIYLPTIEGVNWSEIKANPSVCLIVTEGELKSCCATKLDMPTIGLGGVWSFGHKRKGHVLLDSLAEFEWSGRDVFICYDSDAVTNEQVVKAEGRLAAILVDHGALVRIVRLPQDGTSKVGLDDYIVKHGKDAFKKLCADTDLFALCRPIHELSGDYAVILDNGLVLEYKTGILHKARTFIEVREAPRKLLVDPKTKQVSSDFSENTLPVSAAARWIESPSRPEFTCLDYAPGQGVVTAKGGYNSWKPSNIVPTPGDTRLFDTLVGHLVPNEAERRWLLQWFAYPISHPGTKLHTAVALWSPEQGQGKSLLGSTIGALHGESNFIEIKQRELASSFNDWQACRTFIMGSELVGDSQRDAREFADALKSIITADTITVNKKHQPLYVLPNVANYFLTSNHQTALHLDEFARRFMVIRANGAKLPQSFYSKYAAWLKSGDLGGLLHKMLTLGLAGFEPGADAPHTTARADMVAANRSDLQAWCHALKDDPDSVLVHDKVALPHRFVTASELLRIYERNNRSSRVNVQQLGNELAACGFTQAHKNPISIPGTGTRVRLWVVRDRLKAANMTPEEIGREYARRIPQAVGPKKVGAK